MPGGLGCTQYLSLQTLCWPPALATFKPNPKSPQNKKEKYNIITFTFQSRLSFATHRSAEVIREGALASFYKKQIKKEKEQGIHLVL